MGGTVLAVRKNRTVGIAYLSGAVTGATGVALASATAGLSIDYALGRTLFRASIALLMVVIGGGLLFEPWSRRRLKPPTLRRQVDRSRFLAEPVTWTALVWGAELGAGVFTRINTWAFWAVLVLIALAHSPTVTATAVVAYGGARGMQGPMTRIAGDARAAALVAWLATHDRRNRIAAAPALMALATGGAMLLR
jgi:hypothetical protein